MIRVGLHAEDANGREQAGIERALACGMLGVAGVNVPGNADVDAATGAFEEVNCPAEINPIKFRQINLQSACREENFL